MLGSLATLVALAAPARSATLVDDGFESGSLAGWTVTQAGDGSATVVTDVVRTGTYSALLAETGGGGSVANLRRTLATAQTDLTVAADVRIEAEGTTGGNVPIVRLFDAAGTRLVSFYRQNQASDKLYVQHNGTFNLTSGLLPLGSWARVSVHVVTAGPNSTVAITLNGTAIYSTTVANLGTGGVRTVQLGNDVAAQPFRLYADNVSVTNDIADTTAPDTTIDAGPQGTVASTTASFSFSASESGAVFECRLDASAWSACSSPHTSNGLAAGSHTFAVRATDAAGNVDPSPAQRTWTIAFQGGTCDTTAPPPNTSDPGTLVIADGFESGNLGAWTAVTTQGDATATVQQQVVHRGRCALRLHVTTQVVHSRANITKTLPAGTTEVWADGWFDIETEGVRSTWNTPTFRVFSGGRRVFDVSRQNGDANFFVRYPNAGGNGWTIISPGRQLSVDRWYHIKIHVVAAGNLSTAEVWLDDALVYRTTTATLGVTTFDTLMVGAEHQNQEGDVAADDIVVKAVVPPPSPVVFTDGFESGGFAAWTEVGAAGGGTATVQGSVVRTGARAASLTTTATTTSLAYLRHTLPAVETDLTVNAAARVVAEGGTGGVVPLVSLLDAGWNRRVFVYRNNGTGRVVVQHAGGTVTTGATLPLGTWAAVSVHGITAGPGASTIEVKLDGATIFSTTTADLGATGLKTIQIGNHAASKGYTIVVDDVSATTGAAGPADDPRYKLLIADYLNRRLLITDFDGRVVWEFDNPTGSTDALDGPIGVRWLPGNQILATFGGGTVGVIDVATKTWVWQTRGFNGDAFQSPYDAELLPDGRLAVALRFNDGGRVSVYDLASGTEVWRHLSANAHSVHYRPGDLSYGTTLPTLLVGGFGAIREVTYQPGTTPVVAWQIASEFTHDAIVVDNDRVLTTEGYYIQLVDRAGMQLWRRSTPAENRRMAINPNLGGGYIYTVGEGDRIEFRDTNGFVLREWNRLSDDTTLDYPYGIQVIEYGP